MSLQSMFNNAVNTAGDAVSSVINSSKVTLQNIVGTASTSLSNLWDGGFTGMSTQGVDDLRAALQKYSADIEALIAGFDEKGDISAALKGDTEAAAVEFIEAIKSLLQAWVTRIKQGIVDLDKAHAQFLEDNSEIATDVKQKAQDIRQNAEAIRLD